MRADALARRNAIITTAVALFTEHGEDVALETIAAEAGVGIATLYRNFPDRASLIHACATHLADDFCEFQAGILAAFEKEPDSAAAHLEAYAARLVGLGLPSLIPAFAPESVDELPADLDSKRLEIARNGSAIVTACQRSGVIGPSVSHLELVVGIIALTRPRHVNLNALQTDLTRNMVRLYLAGLKQGL